MSETRLTSPFGEFVLHRYPLRKRELLRAWDAADEYLLQTLAKQNLRQQHILIANDNFGALAVSLHQFLPVSWSDSWLAHQALRENLLLNACDPGVVKTLASTEIPNLPPDLVLLKVPKSLALFENQLLQLMPLLTEKCQVIVAGMSKTMPSSLWKMLERIVGSTNTSLAQKKARLIEVNVDHQIPAADNPYPKNWRLEGTNLAITNHANVFSRERLDIGTRLLLQHLPRTEGPVDIIDLGCGNGVLGLSAAQQNPEARINFVDESYMAIASARANVEQINRYSPGVKFHLGDGLVGFEDNTGDLILCNPPFHQSHAVGDTVAMSMFKESARVLRNDGELWVIGNRHLNYHVKLKRWFGSITVVASNRKFVVLKAMV